MGKRSLYPVLLPALLSLMSCVDKDILHVSDSLEINSRYSLPIGNYDTDINNYLQNLNAGTVSPDGDSVYYMDVQYPIDAKYVEFTVKDSVNFNIVEHTSDKVKSVEFVILISNGYPTKALAQVYFMAGAVTVDSAFATGARVINGADVSDDGLVNEPSTSMLTIPMPDEFVDKLPTLTHIVVKGRLYLVWADDCALKFYPEYKLNLHIGARIELLFNTNEI